MLYLTLLFALSGCGGRLGITARDDGKADLSVFMDTGKAASRLLSSIMASLYPSSSSVPDGGVFTPERAQELERSLSGGDAEQRKNRNKNNGEARNGWKFPLL